MNNFLAPYASNPQHSRGRRWSEAEAPTRNAFQRDRDRIVHSSAFRRLVYKTQVFLNHEGDMFRTRLTHSLEVAQLARSIARPLGLHEDLVEAIALAHDLGHTPFGHAGQDALHGCMHASGGFEHNLQSLRVVDVLEQRYPAFDGLNLCFETREGILKHCSRSNALVLEGLEPNGVGARFLSGMQPSLEAQLCNLADAIAYNAHDVDDGVRSGLLSWSAVREVPLVSFFSNQALEEYPVLGQPNAQRRWVYETIRRMLSAQVYDVIDCTRAALQDHDLRHADEVRKAPVVVCFSDAMHAQSQELKRFLFAHLYRHPQVMQVTQQAQAVVLDLFMHYCETPDAIPGEVGSLAARGTLGQAERHRVVADFIAGMTDRFALREHERLTGHQVFGVNSSFCYTSL